MLVYVLVILLNATPSPIARESLIIHQSIEILSFDEKRLLTPIVVHV